MPAITTTDKARLAETLEALMDRLGAPDLTAAEAQALRPVLYRLLETIEYEMNALPFPGSCEPCRCAVA